MSTAIVGSDRPAGFSLAQYLICLNGIVWREGLRFLHQRERFVSALVRPLVWLFIFAAGFRQVLGISIIPPYETYILYEVYIAPGLMAMIQLFNGMQSSLSMVYDREMGNMRTLLVSPLPRWYLLFCKLLAGTAVSLLQVYAFLLIAWFWEIEPPPIGYLTVLPALVLSGLMLGALGMLISSGIKQLENFAGVMNFVIFPMFFASSALYPLWRVQGGKPDALLRLPVQSVHPCGRADPLCALRTNQLDLAGGRWRLHGGLHDRRDARLRSVARADPSRTRRRRDMRLPYHRTVAAGGSADGPTFLRRRSALSRLAVRPGQGARGLARGGVGRSAARRRRGQMEGRPQSERAGGAAGRAAHAARRSREGDHGISCGFGERKGDEGQMLFAGLFDTLNAQRSSVMSGLERVTRKQREAADKVRSDTLALQALQDDPARDQAKIDELGNQLVWETRIFEDRHRVIKFVCEVPTAIDQRLFALGRAIQQEME